MPYIQTGRNKNWMTQGQFDTHNKSLLEQQLLKKELARVDQENRIQQEKGKVSAGWANQFLNQWNQSRAKSEGMFNVAMSDLDTARNYVKDIDQYIGQIQNLADEVKGDYEGYKKQYAPVESEAIQSTIESLAAERGMVKSLEGLARPDLEGASGRAMADVSGQFELARRAQARETQGLGLRPEDTFRQRNKGFIDEAIAKVLAGNTARIGEKNRATGVTLQSLGAINPNESFNIAQNIAQGKMQMRGQQAGLVQSAGGLASAKAGQMQNIATSRAGIAGDYNRSITQPVGEMFATTAGTAMETNPKGLRRNV